MPVLPRQVATLAALVAVSLGIAAPAPACASQESEYASVAGTSISVAEFEGALVAAVRNRYYHRQPQPEQLAALRKEVTDQLVNRVLLLKEARRLGLEPDDKEVQAGVAAYERKLSEAQRNGEFRDQWRSALTRGLREQNLLGQLEGITRRVAAPTQEELRAYYDSHPELFTEPERVRLGLIVIGVDPASPVEAWAEAQARAKELVRALSAGADFAELARRHSSDASAATGGDLGYRHRGRLPQGVEREIDRLQEGAISEPIRLLEGIAVLRLVERKPARLKGFEDVHRSAADLWAREQGEVRWRDLIASLRSGADIRLRAHPPVAEQDRGGAGERAVR